MTPTEQDNELDKILDILIDSVVEARMRWHKQSQRARKEQSGNSGFTKYQSELNYADDAAKDAIMQLITADRKRVALEARINERNKIALDNYRCKTVSESTNWQAKFEYFMDSNERRIAALKAQQEEV